MGVFVLIFWGVDFAGILIQETQKMYQFGEVVPFEK
jgi:hypothetical protein